MGEMPPAPWICPSCARPVATAFCPSCGESPPLARDLTLRGFALQLFHALSDIDGKLLRSLLHLVTRPGALTAAYVRGERLRWLGPLQLFLLANVLFFATQSVTHANIVSSTLDSHLHRQDWSELARTLVAQRLEARGTTLEAFEPRFDQAAVLNAKSLIILMALPFALVLPLLFRSSAQPFAAHAVFSLHAYAFLLLLFCAILLLAAAEVLAGGQGVESSVLDKVLALLILVVSAVYLWAATGRFYGAAGALRVAKVLVLTITVGLIFVGYRFAIFVITLYTT